MSYATTIRTKSRKQRIHYYEINKRIKFTISKRKKVYCQERQSFSLPFRTSSNCHGSRNQCSPKQWRLLPRPMWVFQQMTLLPNSPSWQINYSTTIKILRKPYLHHLLEIEENMLQKDGIFFKCRSCSNDWHYSYLVDNFIVIAQTFTKAMKT